MKRTKNAAPPNVTDTALLSHRTMSSMVQSWSHMMYKAEDHFLNFMEDMTDPGHHHHHHRIDQDSDDSQAIYYGSIDHYDDYDNSGNNDFQTADNTFLGVPLGSFDIHRHVSVEEEEWNEDVNRMTNPIGFVKLPPQRLDIHRYVAVEDDEKTGGITRMTNVFGFHDNIPEAEKIMHLNRVLGGTQQHGTHSSQVLLGGGNDLVPPHETLHPQPTVLHQPQSPSPEDWHRPVLIKSPFIPTRAPSAIIFEDESSPPQDGLPHPRFRPSPLMDELPDDEWVAAEHPGTTTDMSNTDARLTSQTSRVTEDQTVAKAEGKRE